MFFARNIWIILLGWPFFAFNLFGKKPFYFYNAYTLDLQETLIDVGITKDNDGLPWIPSSSFAHVHYGLFENSTIGSDFLLFLKESPNVFLKHRMFETQHGTTSFSSFLTYIGHRKEISVNFGFTHTVMDANNADITVGLFDVYNSFSLESQSISSHRFLGFLAYDWRFSDDFIFAVRAGIPILTTVRSSLLLKRSFLWFQSKHINFLTKEILDGPYSSINLSKEFGSFKLECGFLGYELTNLYPYASSSWRF